MLWSGVRQGNKSGQPAPEAQMPGGRSPSAPVWPRRLAPDPPQRPWRRRTHLTGTGRSDCHDSAIRPGSPALQPRRQMGARTERGSVAGATGRPLTRKQTRKEPIRRGSGGVAAAGEVRERGRAQLGPRPWVPPPECRGQRRYKPGTA